jgi:hypothetical protein
MAPTADEDGLEGANKDVCDWKPIPLTSSKGLVLAC